MSFFESSTSRDSFRPFLNHHVVQAEASIQNLSQETAAMRQRIVALEGSVKTKVKEIEKLSKQLEAFQVRDSGDAWWWWWQNSLFVAYLSGINIFMPCFHEPLDLSFIRAQSMRQWLLVWVQKKLQGAVGRRR